MLGLLAMGCTDNDPNAQRLMFPPTEDTFHVVSFGVTYLFSDTLRVSARLQAGQVVEVQQFNESGRKELETIHYLSQGVRLEFLDNRGRPQSVITSDSARFNREAGLARLAKGVLLRNDQGEQLETEELFWNQATDSIYTDQRVKITTPDKVIIGREGLRANSAFTAYSLFGIEGEMEALEDP
jgi:LPS export ABC transporter protein LptC